ncbi:hypothetical protein ACN38_g7050 [Penicillium nordicum]|uniref:Uncharacterized protein n=1 Tax=Penicillium nordicum TaxID=229535 RepID=A0A0M8P631_9EURO|nr:hypothetical protein ACN38_g7050 [Penicillium nordicum]
MPGMFTILSPELRCACTSNADYVHGPIKVTKDKTFHGKREAQLLSSLSLSLSLSTYLFLPFEKNPPSRNESFNPTHNWLKHL